MTILIKPDGDYREFREIDITDPFVLTTINPDCIYVKSSENGWISLYDHGQPQCGIMEPSKRVYRVVILTFDCQVSLRDGA